MPTTEPQPTTTTPDMISLPNPSPLTSQPLDTTPTSLHPSRSTLQPQSSPLTDIIDHTTDASTSAGLLESKHIFGIIVGGVLLIVLIIVGVMVIGFLLILTARRRNRHQFVETFIETTDNDAYTIRKRAPHTRSHNGHITQHLHMALIPRSNDSTIATKNNVAYLTSSEASMTRSHQANDITVSTFMGPQNGSLNHTLNSHPNHNTIVMERNISYLTSSEASVIRHKQAKNTKSPLTGLHNGDLNRTPNSSPNTIATERNIAYLTNSETSGKRSHQANATAANPVMGAHKGDVNRTIEMKVNEAYHTRVSTLGHGLPDDTETSMMMPDREVLSSLANGSRSGMGRGNRGQSSHKEQPVKPYEIIKLPII